MDEFMKELKFNENGLIPAVVQDYNTRQVLMLAYMNEESIRLTFEKGLAHYYSRSRQKIWLKGETSGHFQYIKKVLIDCDKDTLLLLVEQVENACHTGSKTCFYTKLDTNGFSEFTEYNDAYKEEESKILYELQEVIHDRKLNPKEGSYTNYLFEKGIDKILKKVGEETSEVIIAAKNNSPEEIKYETADLIYHLLVMLEDRKVDINKIFEELKNRR